MKLCFLTNALVNERLSSIAAMANWAADHGFDALEIGPRLPLDEHQLEQVQRDGKVQIAALTYCRNFLSRDTAEAETQRDALHKRIESAGRHGIPIVVTSTGFDNRPLQETYDRYESIRRRPETMLDDAAAFLENALVKAEQCGVSIALENCPLMGNIAISPVMWELLLARLSSPNLGIAYDPSHFVWQMMDAYRPIKRFGSKILHMHAKDTELLRDRLSETGILTDFSWWRYRLPGEGELDWKLLLYELREINYQGAISLEHEDPLWSGSPDKVRQGLLHAAQYIRDSAASIGME